MHDGVLLHYTPHILPSSIPFGSGLTRYLSRGHKPLSRSIHFTHSASNAGIGDPQ